MALPTSGAAESRKVANWTYHLASVAVVAVFIVLCLGLWNLLITRSASWSQSLMRWRVGLQFLAIILIMLFFYARYGAG